MKKTIFIIALLSSVITFAQVRMTGTNISQSVSSAFIDASSNSTNNGTVGTGKGLVFPRLDLSTFTFVGATPTLPSNFPTRFDGMIVYNTKDGGAANVGTTDGVLVPGFWFYENKSATLTGGMWKRVGSGATGAIKDITSTEVVLSTKVNGQQLYAISGSFTASGTSAGITVTVPSGMTGYYSFVIYKDGKTFRSAIVSFDIAATTNNVITGSGPFSEIYPAGDYNYVLEYFK
jgi:hypothetical protein